MKKLFLLVVVLAIVNVKCQFKPKFKPIKILSLAKEDVNIRWNIFKTKHNKIFKNFSVESQRQKIFKSNLALINEHNIQFNNGQSSYSLGINRFSDWTTDEFMKYVKKGRLRFNRTKSNNLNIFKVKGDKKSLPLSVDWRTQGYVNPIKDQGKCGSCWTFSTTSALESQYFKTYGKLLSFSEQNLVDCVFGSMFGYKGDKADGCNGGDGNIAYRYIKKNGGINTGDAYPYTGQYSGKCKYDPSRPNVQISGYVIVSDNGDETALTTALAEVGPVRVSVFVTPNFQHYSSGVFIDNTCSKKYEDLNHEVTLVGYGTQNSNDHYILRNQWGTSWGVNGYMYFARNRNNQCGIAMDASYPVIKH